MNRLVILMIFCSLTLILAACDWNAGGIVGSEEQVPLEEIQQSNKVYAEQIAAGTKQAMEESQYSGK